jgi:hypothetical protein
MNTLKKHDEADLTAQVISVSRRTDIPAFYSDWLMNRLQAGFCHWLNPFSQKVSRVSLAPDDCIALVFWTRNPAPLLAHIPELDARGYSFYVLYTLLDYPPLFEPGTPGIDAAVETFRQLSSIVPPERVFWRYDPVIVSSITPHQFHIERFSLLARRLEGLTHRCIFSFLDEYGKTRRNLGQIARREGVVFETPTPEQQQRLVADLSEIAQAHGMHMHACCEPQVLSVAAVRPCHCVDVAVLRQVTAHPHLHLKQRPTRTHCGCYASVDIGSYQTCLAGCAYCYATDNHSLALQRHAAHDPHDTILARPARLQGVDLDSLT